MKWRCYDNQVLPCDSDTLGGMNPVITEVGVIFCEFPHDYDDEVFRKLLAMGVEA